MSLRWRGSDRCVGGRSDVRRLFIATPRPNKMAADSRWSTPVAEQSSNGNATMEAPIVRIAFRKWARPRDATRNEEIGGWPMPMS